MHQHLLFLEARSLRRYERSSRTPWGKGLADRLPPCGRVSPEDTRHAHVSSRSIAMNERASPQLMESIPRGHTPERSCVATCVEGHMRGQLHRISPGQHAVSEPANRADLG